jgi:hypothetical protein
MQTGAQTDRNQRLATKSERLAIHTQNCQTLVEAYVQRRGQSPRLLRNDIDALLKAVTMEHELWEPNFDAHAFLHRLPPTLRWRHGLS